MGERSGNGREGQERGIPDDGGGAVEAAPFTDKAVDCVRGEEAPDHGAEARGPRERVHVDLWGHENHRESTVTTAKARRAPRRQAKPRKINQK